ncbi:MAG: hypothetical protein WBB19_10455 [Desulforhopalus sp.]
MKYLPFSTSVFCSTSLFFCCLFLISSLCGAQFEEDVSTDQYLYATGIVRSISPENQTVTFKQKKGSNITIFIDEATVLEGFYKLKELKIRQKIKVWYQPREKNNKALKIIKPLELGC